MSLLSEASETQALFDRIPVIDLTRATSTTPSDRQALAKEVRSACMTAGFFYVTNHGIPKPKIDGVFNASKTFFAQEEGRKMEIRNQGRTTSNFKGYVPPLSSNNDPKNKGDLHEGFCIGYEALPSESTSHSSSKSMPRQESAPGQESASSQGEGGEGGEGATTSSAKTVGDNLWPSGDGMDTFRQDVLGYYHAAVGLGRTLFPLFAMALGMEEGWFDGKTRNAAAIMRLLHYPSQEVRDERVMGIGAHTDWECFTILWQQPGIQALQVLSPADGKWVDAPAIEGALVINLGDQFMRWTNGIFQSNVHRAINTSGAERYSIPLFFGTDYDVLLEPIPSCVSGERPAKYEVITAGEFIQERLRKTYIKS